MDAIDKALKNRGAWTSHPTVTTPAATTTVETPKAAPVAAPPPPAAAAPPPPAQDNSPGAYLHWLATASPMANFQRAFEDRFTRGGLDTLFSHLPSPAKGNMSTEDFLAQERAKTQSAKDALSPVMQGAADVAGYGMSAPLFNAVGLGNPIVQGMVSGGVNAVGHGGSVKDIAAQSAEEGAAGALSIPLSKYVFNPVLKAVRNTVGSGPPSSVVYPYVKPGGSTQSPTLGGVPGFRDPTYPANMSAEDLGRMAREMEGMPNATGEGGEAKNALMEIMRNRINTVAEQGAPSGGAPGSGINAVREAYWGAGGPPSGSGAAALPGVQSGMAKAVGAGVGGAAGHVTGIPGASGAGAVLGAEYGPKALAWLTNPTPASVYPALGVRPPSAQQALANLLIGGTPDVDQYLRQQGWPGQ